MMSGLPDPRLIHLEMHVTEQERTIAELSDQVSEQWKVIDRLQKTVAALTERLLTVEDRTAPDVPVTRPPHW